MSYLSCHVHRIICEIPEIDDIEFPRIEPCHQCNAYNDRTCYCGGETGKKLYLLNARKLWKSNEDNNMDFENSVKYMQWTGYVDTIADCMKQSVEQTNLSILKLTVIMERSLGDIFTTIAKVRCPSLLKDLLQTETLLDLLGESIIARMQTLMGPPISLNLRNVLWHGFPLLGEMHHQYSQILIKQIIHIGQILEEKQIDEIKHRPKLRIPNTDLMKNCFKLMDNKDVLFKLFKSTAFIPVGMIPQWKLAVHLFFCGRYSDAVIIFLPQLEHALRCLFTVVNNCPNRMVTAESDTLYTTFDEILAKHVDSDTPNRLLTELGTNTVEMLYDLLYFPEGPRLRDRLSHDEYDFDDVNQYIANHVISIGLCLCIKYLFPWRQCLRTENRFLADLCSSMERYQSIYHPVSFLMREICEAMVRVEAVSQAIEDIEITTDKESDSLREKMMDFGEILSHILSLSASIVDNNGTDHLVEIDHFNITAHLHGTSHLDQIFIAKEIQKMVTVRREVMHRPKYEIEIIGILRKITTQVNLASEQVKCSVNEKRIQFENRTLRSRARNNFMTMLTMIPVLISFWLTLLCLASIEGLMCKEEDAAQIVKFLKKCLKYAENVKTLCSSMKNQWLECLHVAEKLSEIVKIRLNHSTFNISIDP